MKKKCIFHVPNYVEPKGLSGSSVRPFKMIEGFQNNGYEVDIVMGYGKERKKQINKIKKNILQGTKYDFLYSESSTMPTLLTEKNHLPLYPFLDFEFLKFCKNKGIKIGLFYRDIYWKFPLYKEQVGKVKAYFAVKMYIYDLYKYNQLLNVLFLPSIEMRKYLNEIKTSMTIIDLPPGTNPVEDTYIKTKKCKILKLLYVGGISRDVYDLTYLLKAIINLPNIELTICCRKKEWEVEEVHYEKYLSNKVTIVHTYGRDLQQYYFETDMCCLITNISEYRSFSMPIKLFEYLSYQKPIIITEGSVGAKFVQDNRIGIVVKNNVKEIQNKLQFMISHKEYIDEIANRMTDVCEKNSWHVRAQTVIDLLK